MFYLTIFVVCTLGYVNAEQIKAHFPADKAAELLPIVMSCIAETGVSPDVLVKTIEKPVSDKKFDKFIYCAFTKTGYVDKSGLVKVDEAIKLFPKTHKKEVRDAMEECNKVAMKENSPSGKTSKYYFCFVEKTPVRLGI